jgi:SAM-dependent methyltransferase
MKIHKRPISPEPSKLLSKYAEEIATSANGPIFDVGCGYGRNAILLSSFGVPVVCADNCAEALEYIESLDVSGNQEHGGRLLSTMSLDLVNDPWPFQEKTLGAIINVHCFFPNVLECFLNSLKVGGFLFIETIDGHGKNYRELPPCGFVKTKLADTFEIRYFQEKKVGPPLSDASTVKLFAIKR